MDIEVVVRPQTEDWLTIEPVLSDFRKEVELERLPGLINQTLVAWLKENRWVKVRAMLPIVEGGSTVAVHVWFETIR